MLVVTQSFTEKTQSFTESFYPRKSASSVSSAFPQPVIDRNPVRDLILVETGFSHGEKRAVGTPYHFIICIYMEQIPPYGRNDRHALRVWKKGQTRRQRVFAKRKQYQPPCLPLLFSHVAQSFRMERSEMRNLNILLFPHIAQSFRMERSGMRNLITFDETTKDKFIK